MKRPIASHLILAGLLLSPVAGFSQATTLSQDFETVQTATTLGYSSVGGVVQTGTSNSLFQGGTVAPNTQVGISGSRAFTVSNNSGNGSATATLDFENTRVTLGATTTFSFRLAAYAIGNNRGFNETGSVVVSLSSNGTTNFTAGNILTLTGPAGNPSASWDYSSAGTYSGAMGALPVAAQIVPGAGYSTVTLTLPTTITQILVRIVLTANDKNALAVDDVVLNSTRPLPVELVAFTASRQNSAVQLKWTTASEVNNDRFEVQRSADGQTFTTISTVAGAGTATKATAYTSTDAAPLAGSSYYRLRQVDTDGSASYSPVRVVGAVLAVAYPSPTFDLLNLPGTAAGTPYRIFNSLGQTLKQGTVPPTGILDVQQLQPGSYFLETGSSRDLTTQRFIRR